MAAADTRCRRHYLLRQRQRGVWYPDLAGVVRGYPATLASFEARQAVGRARFADIKAKTGHPPAHVTNAMPPMSAPGWARHRAKRLRVWAVACAEAKQIVDKLIKRGIMADETEDDKAAAEALAYQIAVHRDPAANPKLRLQASKTVLEFTKAKPVNRIEAKVNAEDWLSSLLTEADE